MKFITAFISGLIFGIGLIVSGMTNPGKVIGFLDIFGHWDPSLAFVMGGAILVAAPAFALSKRRKTSLLGEEITPSTHKRPDFKLIIGSLLFGIGWGLVGYCPGPAVASVLDSGIQPLIFVAAMLIGLAASNAINNAK
jgi:uncharacterized membrane protein YedE/YeeE